MRMFSLEKFAGYETLRQQFERLRLSVTPAELHGLITGLLCGNLPADRRMVLLEDLANDGEPFSEAAHEWVLAFINQTNQALNQSDTEFSLLLPVAQPATAFARADALAGWTRHFLIGLGVAQPGVDKLGSEAQEALEDLRQITQLGYDRRDSHKEAREALAEICRHVIFIVEFFHYQFCCQPLSTAPPTIH